MELLLPHPSNSTPLTVLGFLERAASVYGDCPSILHATNNTVHTWSETHNRCLRIASALTSSSLGINRGQVVSVVGPNVPSVYELQFAVSMSGAILNNINSRLDAHALSVLLRHSESKLVFVDQSSISLVLEAKPHLVLLNDDEEDSSSASDFLDTYEGIMERGDSRFKWIRPQTEWKPMVLNYTSGTTSSPKGVVLSHRAIFMHTVMTSGAPPPAAIISRAESSGFNVSHSYGLTETGGPVVSCAWKPEWNHLGPLERARLKSRQGVRTIGFAEVDVRDRKTGKSVEHDGVSGGEIVFRGSSVMLGYYKDPEGTAACMREDGWFYSGDIGVIHKDGYLEVKDRSKDVIICGGENISSAEVETVLYTKPVVKEAAVVAKPDKMWGETPCAFVSLKHDYKVDGSVTEREIREFCKTKLPKYMVPRKVIFQEELPKTSTGKIRKFLLRQMAKSLS
ncbi:hypothetical protein EUTSA_v10009822mg [Eutrema salsugineum]|uniref:AMP-dependent synthetase/ligase domain-containing protein n=1 Tax=Eutrema salsugineum TaxID=72664 RepID=V4KAE4_EUTSA|nr:hypothetical protein EUTSA_v10009822mg [Eutrema salsugineum]